MTILPKGWSVSKLERDSGASNYMVRRAKELVKAKGILSTPSPKPAKTLKDDTMKIDCEFYDDEIAYVCQEKKILHL
jgi:hypothetical protein